MMPWLSTGFLSYGFRLMNLGYSFLGKFLSIGCGWLSDLFLSCGLGWLGYCPGVTEGFCPCGRLRVESAGCP